MSDSIASIVDALADVMDVFTYLTTVLFFGFLWYFNIPRTKDILGTLLIAAAVILVIYDILLTLTAGLRDKIRDTIVPPVKKHLQRYDGIDVAVLLVSGTYTYAFSIIVYKSNLTLAVQTIMVVPLALSLLIFLRVLVAPQTTDYEI